MAQRDGFTIPRRGDSIVLNRLVVVQELGDVPADHLGIITLPGEIALDEPVQFPALLPGENEFDLATVLAKTRLVYEHGAHLPRKNLGLAVIYA